MATYFLIQINEQKKFTNDRSFKSLVGPGESGKTGLIFSRLPSEKTFRQKLVEYFGNNILQEYRPSFEDISKKLDIEFVPCLDFGMSKQLDYCPLSFEDSCGEIYQEKCSQNCNWWAT